MNTVTFRDAVAADVPTVVGMYADDELGATREDLSDPLPQAYWSAFDEIAADPRQRLVVAERSGEIVAVLQMSVLAHLAMVGTKRAQIEAVRIRSDVRGEGLGRTVMQWVIAEARAQGCGLLQLTTNAVRGDARRFYESLGFVPSHIGMKLLLRD